MNKQEFLSRLRKDLKNLPQAEIEERITFYSEMIDDRMEEGLSEEEAVTAVDPTEETLSLSVPSPANEKPQRKAWEIVLLVLGSPIWLSLGIAAFAVALSLYVCLWAVIVSLWAVFASLAGCGIGFMAAGIFLVCNGYALPGIALMAAGAICAGLSIFMFLGCKGATKGVVAPTKKVPAWIKRKVAA